MPDTDETMITNLVFVEAIRDEIHYSNMIMHRNIMALFYKDETKGSTYDNSQDRDKTAIRTNWNAIETPKQTGRDLESLDDTTGI